MYDVYHVYVATICEAVNVWVLTRMWWRLQFKFHWKLTMFKFFEVIWNKQHVTHAVTIKICCQYRLCRPQLPYTAAQRGTCTFTYEMRNIKKVKAWASRNLELGIEIRHFSLEKGSRCREYERKDGSAVICLYILPLTKYFEGAFTLLNHAVTMH